MPQPTAQTEEQLRSQGYRPAAEAEWQAFLGKVPHSALAPHARASAGAKRCTPGAQCFETPCIDGKKGVIYCNDNGICAGNQYIIDC